MKYGFSRSLIAMGLFAKALMAQTTFQGDIQLSGKVTDLSGKAIAKALVTLKKANLAGTTDAQGEFSLVRSASGISRSSASLPLNLSAEFRDGQLILGLSRPTSVHISVRSLNGNLVSNSSAPFSVGTHAVPMPRTSQGLYFFTIAAESEEMRFSALSTGGNWQRSDATPMSASLAGAARQLATFDDTLKVAMTGYADNALTLTNPVQSGIVVKLAAKDPGEDPGTIVNGCPVKMEGWAQYANTTGGGDATPQKVASVDELRTLSKDTVPRVLLLEGTYDLGANYLKVGSNKTFLGVGKNAVVKAGVAGFSLRLSHNVILRNLTVQGGGDVGTEGGDAVTATQAERLWFDHLTITDGPDGILDLTQGTTNATVSWCKIYYTSASQPHRYAMQFSSGSYVSTALTDRGKLDITMHHNWFGALVDQRMPRHLWGRGHVYNSFYNSPNNTYCIGAGSWASILIENNYFKDVNDPHRYQDDCPTYLAASGNTYDNAAGKKETGLFAGNSGCLTGGAEAVIPGPWKPPYKYTLADAKEVPDLVKRCAGPQ